MTVSNVIGFWIFTLLSTLLFAWAEYRRHDHPIGRLAIAQAVTRFIQGLALAFAVLAVVAAFRGVA